MSIEVRKKDRESSISLLRRFVRRVQQSGVLINARKGRFYDKGQTKRQKKQSALRREELKKLRAELFKAGQIKEGEMIPRETVRRYLGK
jgi:ribosomal protein S21